VKYVKQALMRNRIIHVIIILQTFNCKLRTENKQEETESNHAAI